MVPQCCTLTQTYTTRSSPLHLLLLSVWFCLFSSSGEFSSSSKAVILCIFSQLLPEWQCHSVVLRLIRKWEVRLLLIFLPSNIQTFWLSYSMCLHEWFLYHIRLLLRYDQTGQSRLLLLQVLQLSIRLAEMPGKFNQTWCPNNSGSQWQLIQ